jgi:hypothetical protein
LKPIAQSAGDEVVLLQDILTKPLVGRFRELLDGES